MSGDAALTILMVVVGLVVWARRFWFFPVNFTGKRFGRRFLAAALAVLATVAAASAQVLGSAHLSGRVVDERTRLPIPGARVNLSLESGKAPAPIQQTITDQDGRYAFEGVAAGRYWVDV